MLTWAELERRGYELCISKQGWSVWFGARTTLRELITSGSKRPGTPKITIQKRAYPYIVADFVKRRVDDPVRPNIDVDDMRAHAQRALGEWMAKTVDEKMYEALKKYKR